MNKNKDNNLKGYTLIEIMISLLIASAFSVGVYSIFVDGVKSINREEVLTDVKNYVTNSLEIIASNIESAEEINIESYLGSNVIILNSNGQSEIRYAVINNLICENETPIKLPGYHWLLNNQSIYQVDIDMTCLDNNVTFYESENEDIRNSIYDVEIAIEIESKIDNNYQENYKAYNRVFAINKFSLL